ncbi:hypothetical protein FACS1894156_9070 [Bacteroidia bacterium]|nr:hypothetical protein FACS1894156_9070 [Bacteroidia bacterium]
MKTIKLTTAKALACLLFICAFSFVGCALQDGENSYDLNPQQEATIVDMQDFSLSLISCSVKREDSVVYLINSKGEFLNIISCGGDAPEIDFDKYTLLVATKGVHGGVFEHTKQLVQIAENEYHLNVDVILDMTGINGDYVVVSVLVSKLLSNATIRLNVQSHFN